METWTELKVYLNNNTENVTQITDYFSFIWTDRYNEVGDFELQLPYTEENATKYQLGYLITCNLSSGVMIIENITVSISFDGGRILIVKGRSIESILSRRVVAETFVRTPDDYDSNKLITCLNDICKLCFSSTVNIMSEKNSFASYGYIEVEGRDDLGLYHDADGNYVFIAPNGDSLGHISRSEVSIEATGKDLLSILQEQCQLFGFGFRLRYIVDPNNDEGYFKIEIYDGIDKSETIQYSEENRNLSSIEYDTDSTDYKNYIFVQGDEVDESSGEAEVSTVEYKQETNSKKKRLRMNKEYKAKADINVYTTLVKTNPNQEPPIKYVLQSGNVVTFSSVSLERAVVSTVNGKHSFKDGTKVNGTIDLGINGSMIDDYFEEVGDYDVSQYVYFNPSSDSNDEMSPSYYRTGISLKDSNGKDFSGLDRREAYLDSSITKGLNINEKYAKRLRKEGLLELTRQYGLKTQISCQIMHDTLYSYGINFNVGDIIGIKFNPIIVPGDIGSSSVINLFKMRAKEYTISHSTSGLDLYPTLDLYDPNYWNNANNGIIYSDIEEEVNGDLKRVKVNFYYHSPLQEIYDGTVKGASTTDLDSFFNQHGDVKWAPIFKQGKNPDIEQLVDYQNDTIGFYTIIETGDWIPVPSTSVNPLKYDGLLYSFNGWYLDNSDGPLISVNAARSKVNGDANDEDLWKAGARYVGLEEIEPNTSKDDPVNLLECNFYAKYVGIPCAVILDCGEHGKWNTLPNENEIKLTGPVNLDADHKGLWYYGTSGNDLYSEYRSGKASRYKLNAEDGWKFSEWIEKDYQGEIIYRGTKFHQVDAIETRYIATYEDAKEYVKITWRAGKPGKFTDEEHANDKSYTITVEKGSTISVPNVEPVNPELYYRDETNPWAPTIKEIANENRTYTANWKRADSRNPQDRDKQTIYQDPDEQNPTPTSGPGQSWTGQHVLVDDNQTKVDNKSFTESPVFTLKHFKSYACVDGDEYSEVNDYNLAPLPELLVNSGGITEQVYQDGDVYVKESPTKWAKLPRIVKDGEDQYFEVEETYDIGDAWLVARFINPPCSRAKAYEFMVEGENIYHSKGNAFLNSQDPQYGYVFCPIFTLSMYRKIEGTEEHGGCVGIWWWRFGNGAKVAEVAFSTTPVFIPNREFEEITPNGYGIDFNSGSYYTIRTENNYHRIWSRPYWWGREPGYYPYQRKRVFKRARKGWNVGFMAQAYDDKGNRIDAEWKRNAGQIELTINNCYRATSDSESGPWTVVEDDKVSQQWLKQLSYVYGKYWDGEHGSGDEHSGNNTIEIPYCNVNPLSAVRTRSSGFYSTFYRSGLTNSMNDVYKDSGLQFTIIPDERYEANDVFTNDAPTYINHGNEYESPTNGTFSDAKPDSPLLYPNYVATIRVQNAGSPKSIDFGSGYLFGSRFQTDYTYEEGVSVTTYKELYNLIWLGYPNDRYEIPNKWVLSEVEGKGLCRRYVSGNDQETDKEIGWLVGTEACSESNDPILKISGGDTFLSPFSAKIYNAYAVKYGDIVYFNCYDEFLNIYSELGFINQITFKWQVFDIYRFELFTSPNWSSSTIAYYKDGNTNNYIEIDGKPIDWDENYDHYYKRIVIPENERAWRDIEKDECYRGPIFDMRKTSITDADIGIIDSDTGEQRYIKIVDYYGDIFGETTELFTGQKDNFNSIFGGNNSIFGPAGGPFVGLKDNLVSIRDDVEGTVVSRMPDTTNMSTLRVRVNKQNLGYKYRCVMTINLNNGEGTRQITTRAVEVWVDNPDL